ncbi:MAG: hypothetical protein LBT26_03505 [Clostridiales Family XIII bacterium]|jgi:hypothetical protein|nr:hypothetical protein [Clostridiales Family XIII bacterium]
MNDRVYHVNNMALACVGEILRTAANTVEICRDMASRARTLYTVLVVHDRQTAKKLSAVFEQRRGNPLEEPCLGRFAEGENLCYVFPYRQARSLTAFAEAQMDSPVIREAACVNLVLACLSSPLPYPLLFMLLDKGQIHIEKDNTVFLTPYFDLSELDAGKAEADCATRCGAVLLDILQTKNRKTLKSFALLQKKVDHGAYRQFAELYHDIRLTALPTEKSGWRKRLRNAWERNGGRVFRVLLALSVICAAVALVILVSYLIFGGFPLFRLFGGSLNTIGGEALNT